MDKFSSFLVENQDKEYAELASLWNAKKGVAKKSVDSIRKTYTRLGLPPKRVGKQNIQLPPEQQLEVELEKLRISKSNKPTEEKLQSALKKIVRLEQDISTLMEVKDTVNTYTIRPSKSEGGEAVAVVVASDWHVEENVRPETVNGTNEYNMRIAKQRAEKFFQHALQLTKKEQQDVTINTMCLALLGDFFSGNIHDELLASCEVGPQDAMIFAQNLIASGIQFILDNSKLNLVIPCTVGNHSRMTHKIHVSDEHGLSLEWAMYNFLAMHFRGNKRVQFVLSRSYHNYVDILGYKIRFHHGHAIKFGGGIGGLTIPVLKAIARFDQDQQAYLDVFGHFHELMHNKKFVVNGSLIGDSPYGKRLGFTGRPEQAFFLIDKKRGKTVSVPILF